MTGRRHRTRDAALAITAIVALAGCGSSVTSSAQHSSVQQRQPWHLVALGDSLPFGQHFCGGCRTFVALFGADVQQMAGVPVAVQNLSEDTGIDSRDLRREIISSVSMRNAVAHADIVTLTIGHNDPPWNSLHDPCDGKGGYPHAAWARYRGTCLRKTAAMFRRNVSAILSAIVALRAGRPTAIRVTNDYNDLIGDPAVPRSDYPVEKHAFDLFTAIPCRLAAQYHAVCVDTYHAFNGAHGLNDAGPLLAPDHTHPSQRGHTLVAALLVKTGWAPLHPWDADASGRTVMTRIYRTWGMIGSLAGPMKKWSLAALTIAGATTLVPSAAALAIAGPRSLDV